MTPNQFSDFVGPDRVKARFEAIIASARQRGEVMGHVLLVGSPGLDHAALARAIASRMAVGFKSTSATELQNEDDLARVITHLEKRDVLFLDDLHQLPRVIAGYLVAALKEFKLFLPLDQGGFTRPFRVNVPVFTLIGSVPNRESLSQDLLAHFAIVEFLEG